MTIDEFRNSGFYPSRTRTFRRDEATDRRPDKRPLIRAEENRRVSGSGITAPWRTSASPEMTAVAIGAAPGSGLRLCIEGTFIMSTPPLQFPQIPLPPQRSRDYAVPDLVQEYGLSCRFPLGQACCHFNVFARYPEALKAGTSWPGVGAPRPMSALGQKQTIALRKGMSALPPPKADIHRAGAQCAVGLGMWPSFAMARRYLWADGRAITWNGARCRVL